MSNAVQAQTNWKQVLNIESISPEEEAILKQFINSYNKLFPTVSSTHLVPIIWIHPHTRLVISEAEAYEYYQGESHAF